MNSPGRICPTHYLYNPEDLAKLSGHEYPQAVYVVGGLYGNHKVLKQILKLCKQDKQSKIIFNGDFNWFNNGIFIDLIKVYFEYDKW